MATQILKRKRTLIKFAKQVTNYIEGEGARTSWETIQASVGFDDSGKKILTDCFYCEWLNSYGANAIQQQSDGTIQPARVRMTYVKVIYDALQNKDVKIYKNGVIDNNNCYELCSAADNYIESNKMLEFQVKKYEVK